MLTKYECFFWWLEGYLSVETTDTFPIIEKMKEFKQEEVKRDCICGCNCGGEDCMRNSQCVVKSPLRF
jgi:hypothetical protein